MRIINRGRATGKNGNANIITGTMDDVKETDRLH